MLRSGRLALLGLGVGLAVLAVMPGVAADLYRFDFDHGRYSISLPTSEAPEVTYYIDEKGGEFKWAIDGGGPLTYLNGMTHSINSGNWYYNFDNCKELERGANKTLKVDDLRWKYSIADVVLNIDDSERTFVDVWITRRAMEHDLRFSFTRMEDHEETLKLVKEHLKTVKFWD